MAEAFGVKGEAYDDLDELAARYVEPVQARMQALVAHRKWKAGSWEQVQEELRAEKARVDARMAVTCLGEDAARGAGAFYLAFITSNTPRREFFAVTPNGFYFRKHVSPAAAAGSSPAWAGPVGRLCSADACRRAPLRCMRSAHHSPYRPPPLFRRHTPALMPC
jgi:transcription elongation factor SPT6